MATISQHYLDLQADLHRNPQYGVASLAYAPLVGRIFSLIGGKSIADYGAGKCNLQKGLKALGLENFQYFPYDPVFPDYGEPREADLVCCIDVLEHVEDEYIDNVIGELARITTNYGFFTIATGPAKKFLADGRNAHLTQKPTSWWLPKFLHAFNIEQLQKEKYGFWFIVTPVSGPKTTGIVLPTIQVAQNDASEPNQLRS